MEIQEQNIYIGMESSCNEPYQLCYPEQTQEYSCAYCSETIPLSKLKEHITLEHVQLAFCCGLCDMAFESTIYLNDHMSSIHQGFTNPLIRVQMVLQIDNSENSVSLQEVLMLSLLNSI